MHQPAEVTGFSEKAIQGILVDGSAQDFERDLRVQIQVLAQIDISEDAHTNQAAYVIIPQLLTCTLYHSRCSYLSEEPQTYNLRNGRPKKGETEVLNELRGPAPAYHFYTH